INQEYIKGISNDYFDLQGINTKEANLTKKIIISDIKKIEINYNYSPMIKLRLLILKNENNLLINLFNNLRKVYVKIFKS
ncbi:hypothetical protein, partial [Limosilactobacillus avistercoris]|uniref:hypothetical protein n=1 Tax=Limosilactobacillus avistercoris TaxID=2762243 RepID=UPI001CD8255C